MKVKFLGKTEFLILTNGKVYNVISVEKGWYRIVDDSGDDYLYPPQYFQIVTDNQVYRDDESVYDSANDSNEKGLRHGI